MSRDVSIPHQSNFFHQEFIHPRYLAETKTYPVSLRHLLFLFLLFLNQQIFDTFRDVIFERGPLLIRTISCRFCQFYGTFLSWSMLVTLLPPRLKCPIMLFHEISWNEILSFMLKCHWINDIQESKVSSFIS